MVDRSKAVGRLSERRKLEEMSWPQVKAAIDAGIRTVVAAAGSMEQHGPHLPLQTDTLLGTRLAAAIVDRLPRALQGPTIPFGVSGHHMPFAGTITLDPDAFKTIVRQYVESLASHGFETIVIVPSHGGNFAPLRELEEELGGRVGNARLLTFNDLMGFMGPMHEVAGRDGISANVAGAHAGEAETSMVLATREDLVSMAHAEEGFVGDFNAEAARVIFEEGMVALTTNGILGDARPATPERGDAYFTALADMLADWIRERIPT